MDGNRDIPGSLLQATLNNAWDLKDKPKRTKGYQRQPIPQWAIDFVNAANGKAYVDLLDQFNGRLSRRDIALSIERDYPGVKCGASLIGLVLRGDLVVNRWGPTREARFWAIKETLDRIIAFLDDQRPKPKGVTINIKQGVRAHPSNRRELSYD